MRHRSRRKAWALVTVAGLLVALAPAAFAQEGASTPGATVTAVNPGRSELGSDLKLGLWAQAEDSTVADPSCRPKDATIQCWGSLLLRVPEFGGMTVTLVEVHRVAVGDIGCGGCGGHEGDDGCDDGGCGGEGEMAVAVSTFPTQAQVNGLGVLIRPGDSGLVEGTKVQFKITLWDNGPGLYSDGARVIVNEFVHGSEKPLIYDSGEVPITIKKVRLSLPDDAG